MDNILSDVSDWANVPGDTLRCIVDMTLSVKDRVRMTAVCHPWQSSLEYQKLDFPVCLMLAETEESDKHCFYNTSEEIFVELDLPGIRGKRCWGSPFGWLVTCDLGGVEFQLFNPLSRACIRLPLQPRTLHGVLEKLILLTSPDDSDSDCIVMAIYFGHDCSLAFAKPGDQAWTMMGDIRCVDDVIYFKGNIYACTHGGEIFLCQDLDGAHPKAVKFAAHPNACVNAKKYLFDLDGNLCMASRNVVSLLRAIRSGFTDSGLTDRFEIFKLDMQTSTWEEIYSLGDNSLFLGNCSTFAIAAADYPGCRPDCIYVSDDHHVNCCADMTYGDRGGIYDCRQDLYYDYMSNVGFVEPFPKSKVMRHVLRSLWIVPYSR